MAVNTNREEILTPTGRLVQGSLYVPNTTDMEGRPLVFKSGDKQGQPRTDYYVAIAIPKKGEGHWAETEWGAKIWAVGHRGFPNGQGNSPSFAWKIIDGDSTTPNRKGTIPANCEGFPGNWILKFNGSEAPTLLKLNSLNKTETFAEKDAIKPGDYIQIHGYVSDNQSQQQPGVFLNHRFVCFRGYGERIILGQDPDSVGFGGDALPAGASAVPASSFVPPSATPAVTNHVMTNIPVPNVVAPTPAVPVPAPYPNVLMPPVSAPVRKMTVKAGNFTYGQYIAAGWDDKRLIQEGMMEA